MRTSLFRKCLRSVIEQPPFFPVGPFVPAINTRIYRDEYWRAPTNPIHRYKIGDSFFQLPLVDAQSMLEASTAQIDADVSKLEDSLGELRDELQQLKVSLYARFGRSINLET